MLDEINKDTENKMQGCVDFFLKDLSSIRTGRASIALVDNIRVDYYGSQTALSQMASIATPESSVLMIQPWDISAMQDIEKAILASDLGITPANDGKVIRLSIPPLTEERRKQLVKVVKKTLEESKIALRTVRRDSMELLKKMEKEKDISQDDQKKGQDDVQGITDKFVKKVEEISSRKEKEVMED